MDFNIFISALQLALAALQLKLDHFKKPANTQEQNNLRDFNDLGDAIRALETALSETVSFMGQTNIREPNPQLASLWEDASIRIRRISNSFDLADLTFQKNLYWRNPEFYINRFANRLQIISLENVQKQLKSLRKTYNRLQEKHNN